MKNKKGLVFLVASSAILFIASMHGSRSRKKLNLRLTLQEQIRKARWECGNAPSSKKREACDKLEKLKKQLSNTRTRG